MARSVTRSGVLALVLAASARAAEIPDAVVVLYVSSPNAPGQVPEAAPPRFVLLEDGQAFVGGTSHLASARLEKGEIKDIEKQISRIRKLPGLGASVALGPGPARRRLILRKGRPLEIMAVGDPAVAPDALRPLAALLSDLEALNPPDLRPYAPAFYALAAREGTLPGGCRPWGFTVPLPDVLSSPRPVPGSATGEWPTGATPASVCSGDKTYVVTLRPLLPGERP